MTIISIILTLIILVFVWRVHIFTKENFTLLVRLRLNVQDLLKEKLLLENQLAGQNLDRALSSLQTTIYGHELTEKAIADWLESHWGPLGDDLTDYENSKQIADRIRRGEYLG